MEFLNEKINYDKIKISHIAIGAGLSNDTIRKLIKGEYKDTSLKTTLRLANFFECSLDEVLGRKKFEKNSKKLNQNFFSPTTAESSMEAIKYFISTKMENLGLDIYRFAEHCGLHKNSFINFIKKNTYHNYIGCNRILAIVDTFDVSLDELIGRINH